jgi:hypothetical protein
MSTALIRQLERTHCQKQSQKVYLALEELDFTWDEREIIQFETLWREGISLWDIAKSFGRDPDEVLILAVDRGRRGTIHKRAGGVFGEARQNSVHRTGESRSSSADDTTKSSCK